MKLFFLAGIFVTLLSMAAVAAATDYYVSPTGSDTNPCTLSQPCKGINFVVQKAMPGDTINLMDGTWYGENIVFPRSGTESQPITLRAYSGNTGMPFLDGVDRTTGTAIDLTLREYINIIGLKIHRYYSPIYIAGASNIYVSDCDIREFSGISVARSYNHAVGSSYNTLNNCTIEDSSWNAIQLNGRYYKEWPEATEAHHIYITNNRIINHTKYHSGSIDLMGTSHDIFITGNYIDGVQNEISYTHSLFYEPVRRVLFKDNYVSNSGAVNIQGMLDSTFENNTIINSRADGFSPGGYGSPIGDSDYTFTPDNATFRNNTIINPIYKPIVYVGNGYFEGNNFNNRASIWGDYDFSRRIYTYIIKDQVDTNFTFALNTGSTAIIKYTGDKPFTIKKVSGSASYSATQPTYNGAETISTVQASGTGYAGIKIEQNSTPVQDTTPPTVTSTDPSASATNIATTKTITVSFSESIQSSTNYNSITLKDSNNNIITTANSISNNVLTIDPSASLAYSTSYTATIPASAVKDSSGNNLASQYSFLFTTAAQIVSNPLNDPSQWTKRYDLVPIIPWNPNSWDKETGGPNVVLINGERYGYYGGKLEERTSGKGRKVGLAFSNDGLLWTKYSGNPIIEFRGTIRDTDYGILGTAIGKNPDGTAALWNDKYVIIFGNYDGIDSTLQWATSIDGKNWTERGETGINEGPPGSGDTGEAYAGSLVRNTDGTWYLFYYGGGPTRTIGVAYGSSPATLVPYSGNPIISPNSSSWDNKMVDRPKVLWNPDSEEWIMAYSGRDGYATSNGIGMANSSNLLQWTKIGRIINHGVSGSSDATSMWASGFSREQTNGNTTWRVYYEAFSDVTGPNGYDGYYGGHMAEAVLNTLQDATPPAITSVSSPIATQVKVVYSEPVEQSSATNISNYAISNGIIISSATLGTDLRTVTLTTSAHTESITYTITVNNVKDRAAVPDTIASNTQKTYQYVDALTVSNIAISNGKTYTTDTLATGKSQYIDRTFTFSTIPSIYTNLSYIKTANDDKASTAGSFLEFDVNKDVTVYVAHDDRITTKPSWLSTFTDTGDNLVSDGGTFSLYAKNYTAGHVALGGNEGGSYSMYSVVLMPLAESVSTKAYLDVLTYFYFNRTVSYYGSTAGKQMTGISALPASGTVSVLANKFNDTFVNFTADATSDVAFAIDLKPNAKYLVRKDGVIVSTVQADPSGKITFSNSDW